MVICQFSREALSHSRSNRQLRQDGSPASTCVPQLICSLKMGLHLTWQMRVFRELIPKGRTVCPHTQGCRLNISAMGEDLSGPVCTMGRMSWELLLVTGRTGRRYRIRTQGECPLGWAWGWEDRCLGTAWCRMGAVGPGSKSAEAESEHNLQGAPIFRVFFALSQCFNRNFTDSTGPFMPRVAQGEDKELGAPKR